MLQWVDGFIEFGEFWFFNVALVTIKCIIFSPFIDISIWVFHLFNWMSPRRFPLNYLIEMTLFSILRSSSVDQSIRVQNCILTMKVSIKNLFFRRMCLRFFIVMISKDNLNDELLLFFWYMVWICFHVWKIIIHQRWFDTHGHLVSLIHLRNLVYLLTENQSCCVVNFQLFHFLIRNVW